jgi:D-glycero-alpha-D-manno-heptose-7-phosphate kinase
VIITSSPLRITLGGGGTDLPSYYEEHTGFLISAAINKYVYITLHEPFEQTIIVRYSKMERVATAEEVNHPIVREALRLMGIEGRASIEVASMSDIPAGTGLGSSGSFTVALLRALHCLNRNSITARELAEQACHIEMDILKEPVGKQDQYIAAIGGITCFTFLPGGRVEVEPLRMAAETLHTLEDNLMLFFTGYTRNASDILHDQDSRSRRSDAAMIDNLHFVKRLAFESRAALEAGDLRRFAALMHDHWEHKKQRSQGMSNPQIDAYYELARANGAIGGKLIGAGGGGFLMFYTEDKTRLRRELCAAGLSEIRFRFDFGGSQVLVYS